MTIILPDPDIGRCPNFTGGWDAYGYPRQKRCLDYAGHIDACTFEPDPERIDPSTRGVYSQPAKPKPWVSPLPKRSAGWFRTQEARGEARAAFWSGVTAKPEAVEVEGLAPKRPLKDAATNVAPEPPSAPKRFLFTVLSVPGGARGTLAWWRAGSWRAPDSGLGWAALPGGRGPSSSTANLAPWGPPT